MNKATTNITNNESQQKLAHLYYALTHHFHFPFPCWMYNIARDGGSFHWCLLCSVFSTFVIATGEKLPAIVSIKNYKPMGFTSGGQIIAQ